MHLQFLEQTVCDFKSFQGEHTIRWDTLGVTFMCGINKTNRLAGNGAGKSSLLDAFCWCLTGKTPGGLKNPDVIPWSGSGIPWVTERLEVDGEEHTVTRRTNPNRLFLDLTEVSQERLEEFLGLNFDLLTNTILLAQGQPLFFDRSPKDKMDLFADTLQLERWDVRAKAAASAADAAEEKTFSVLADKAANEATAAELVSVLEGTKQRAEAWVVEQRALAREAAKKVAVLEKEHEAKSKQLAGALLAEDGAATELAATEKEVSKAARELAVLEREVDKAEATAAAALAQCKRELAQLVQSKTCPTCGQTIKSANIADHKAHLIAQLGELEEKVKNAVPVKTLKALEVLGKRSKQVLDEFASFRQKAEAAQTTVRRLQPEVATLKAQLTELKRLLKEEGSNPHTAQIASLNSRLKALKVENEELAGELKETGRVAERNKFWAKGFKDIKLQLISDVLDELELATNSMIEEVGLVGWEVRYDIERETKSGTVQRALSVQINSPESKGFVRWECWSGGEQQRLRLIGALALADVLLNYAGVQANLEILDEQSTYFSSEGVQELCAFLADRARQTERSIIYIEHNAVESSHFSSKLTVVRDERGSYVRD